MQGRGECLGPGFVPGLGAVVIFHDYENPKYLYVYQAKGKTQWRRLRRSDVQFRKGKS